MAKKKTTHSVFDEPHLRGDGAQPDSSEARAAKNLDRECAKLTPGDAARDSVYDEPDILPNRPPELIDQDWSCSRCGYNLRGLQTGHPCPECRHVELYRPSPAGKPTYATWFAEQAAGVSTAASWRTVLWLACISHRGEGFAARGALRGRGAPRGFVSRVAGG